jgi:hypothetical protein
VRYKSNVTVNGTRNARAELLEKAMILPQAHDTDFFGNNRRPSGANAEHLRIINDTSLRTRLIELGIAEGLQSPKGPQKIASIIRLYPNFDAPPKNAPKSTRAARGNDAPRAAYGLPTVEDLAALLARLSSVELDVSRELQSQVNADIDRLKREIGHLDGDALERTFTDLQRALETRKKLASQVREETFKRLDADTSFEQRKYLRLVSRSSKS